MLFLVNVNTYCDDYTYDRRVVDAIMVQVVHVGWWIVQVVLKRVDCYIEFIQIGVGLVIKSGNSYRWRCFCCLEQFTQVKRWYERCVDV